MPGGAIYVQLIGSKGEHYRRRTEYLVKGAHPKARLNIKKKRIPQGRDFGKRVGTSEYIGLLARLAGAEAATKGVAKSAR